MRRLSFSLSLSCLHSLQSLGEAKTAYIHIYCCWPCARSVLGAVSPERRNECRADVLRQRRANTRGNVRQRRANKPYFAACAPAAGLMLPHKPDVRLRAHAPNDNCQLSGLSSYEVAIRLLLLCDDGGGRRFSKQSHARTFQRRCRLLFYFILFHSVRLFVFFVLLPSR